MTGGNEGGVAGSGYSIVIREGKPAAASTSDGLASLDTHVHAVFWIAAT